MQIFLNIFIKKTFSDQKTGHHIFVNIVAGPGNKLKRRLVQKLFLIHEWFWIESQIKICMGRKTVRNFQTCQKLFQLDTKIRFMVTYSHGMYRIPRDQLFNRESESDLPMKQIVKKMLKRKRIMSGSTFFHWGMALQFTVKIWSRGIRYMPWKQVTVNLILLLFHSIDWVLSVLLLLSPWLVHTFLQPLQKFNSFLWKFFTWLHCSTCTFECLINLYHLLKYILQTYS